jgi:hypothetical protein
MNKPVFSNWSYPQLFSALSVCFSQLMVTIETVKKLEKPALRIVGAALLSIVLVSCGGVSRSFDPVLNENDRNQDLWQSQKITDYRYVLRSVHIDLPRSDLDPHFPPLPDELPPLAIEVHNGAAISVKDAGTGKAALPYLLGAERAGHMDVLFNWVRDAASNKVSRPYAIEAEYDKLLGYPTRVVIEYRNAPLRSVILNYGVSGFESLN